MPQMTARDSKHINAAMNASAFSRRETREQVSVRSTQIGWQRNGKLRSITVRTTASVIIVLVILRQYAASASAVLCIPFAERTAKSGDGIQYLQGSGSRVSYSDSAVQGVVRQSKLACCNRSKPWARQGSQYLRRFQPTS